MTNRTREKKRASATLSKKKRADAKPQYVTTGSALRELIRGDFVRVRSRALTSEYFELLMRDPLFDAADKVYFREHLTRQEGNDD